jgi:site-specific DNA-methyltransferase (adenine-specific)
MNKIYNDDCFNVFKTIDDKMIDMILVDLPYGQTACDWDICIDLKEMWKNLKRICKDECQFVFFTTTKYGYELIKSNPRWFRYDLVWEKHKSVGFLSANKMPLRSHEMIYIFNSQNTDDVELTRNLELREYAKKVLKFIDKKYSEIKKDFGNSKLQHFLGSATTSQFELPSEKTYNELIERYNINKMEGFMKYEDMKSKFKRKHQPKRTYNPQKTPGKPYNVKGHKTQDVYGQDGIPTTENTTGDRHPTSVMKFYQSGNKLHPTQKPLDLCEWLIRTYSNDGDLVLDFCMGSGTTIEACKKSKRQYIGIEKDKDIYETAKNRIDGSQIFRPIDSHGLEI